MTKANDPIEELAQVNLGDGRDYPVPKDGETYECVECASEMVKLRNTAYWRCTKCSWDYDTWYPDRAPRDPYIIESTIKEEPYW